MTIKHFISPQRTGLNPRDESYHNVWWTKTFTWIGAGHANREEADDATYMADGLTLKALYRIRVIPKVSA